MNRAVTTMLETSSFIQATKLTTQSLVEHKKASQPSSRALASSKGMVLLAGKVWKLSGEKKEQMFTRALVSPKVYHPCLAQNHTSQI